MKSDDVLQCMLDAQREMNEKLILKTLERKRSDCQLNPCLAKSLFKREVPIAYLSVDSPEAEWLRKYCQAIIHEAAEFIESAGFKWWSVDKQCDVHNLKVELVDMLHFWLSLCLIMGMSAEDIADIYFQKLQINHQRQDSNAYSRETKTEDDNKSIKT